ncbi:MAG: TM2 domain-containing protein [Lachnospiraceae bacterium]|nr:TM2 domain-containing protein [Lachnospiraceae bacterium]
MFCRNCGKEIMDNEAVCSACGTPVTPVVSVQEPRVQKNNYTANQKSKVAAGILGILLGCYGAHNFYLGYTAKAVIQLVCTIMGILLACIYIGYLLIFGIYIWALVESIMIFTGSINVDANGVPLSD